VEDAGGGDGASAATNGKLTRGWTNKRIDFIVENWLSNISAGRIAVGMSGATRSMVLAKLNRLGYMSCGRNPANLMMYRELRARGVTAFVVATKLYALGAEPDMVVPPGFSAAMNFVATEAASRGHVHEPEDGAPPWMCCWPELETNTYGVRQCVGTRQPGRNYCAKHIRVLAEASKRGAAPDTLPLRDDAA
jgi:hypothetical protein